MKVSNQSFKLKQKILVRYVIIERLLSALANRALRSNL